VRACFCCWFEPATAQTERREREKRQLEERGSGAQQWAIVASGAANGALDSRQRASTGRTDGQWLHCAHSLNIHATCMKSDQSAAPPAKPQQIPLALCIIYFIYSCLCGCSVLQRRADRPHLKERRTPHICSTLGTWLMMNGWMDALTRTLLQFFFKP
jgi:hypothetical protein